MPEGAKIFIVEDHESLRKVMKMALEDYGHTVVCEARSLAEALKKAKEAKGAGVNIAIVDMDLGSGGDDGSVVAEALKREVPGIKIISYSGAVKLPNWGDVNISKNRGVAYVGNIIAKL